MGMANRTGTPQTKPLIQKCERTKLFVAVQRSGIRSASTSQPLTRIYETLSAKPNKKGTPHACSRLLYALVVRHTSLPAFAMNLKTKKILQKTKTFHPTQSGREPFYLVRKTLCARLDPNPNLTATYLHVLTNTVRAFAKM